MRPRNGWSRPLCYSVAIYFCYITLVGHKSDLPPVSLSERQHISTHNQEVARRPRELDEQSKAKRITVKEEERGLPCLVKPPQRTQTW